MAVIKLTPHNLPGMQKHFETMLRETNKKLAGINKKKVQLERDRDLYQDGVEFCKQIYEASRTKIIKTPNKT